MRRTLPLHVYLALSARMEPVARRRLEARLAAGKEDGARIGERFGTASLERPEGPLVWFHAASVGEALALVELLRRLGQRRRSLSFLLTTGTTTSAAVLAGRLPERACHQFVPVDLRPAVSRFLDHWRPDLAVWTESEFWPALMIETHARGIPMLLVNARLSERAFRRWRWFPGTAATLLGRFDHALAQDEVTAFRLRRLGMPRARVEVTGSLKEGTGALPCDEAERKRLSTLLAGRPVWLAASTHEGEEAIVVEAHARAERSAHRLMLLLAPRHPVRGEEIAAMLAARGLRVARRSLGELPDRDTDVLLADTLGEMGLWYRLAPVSFVGGSLAAIGGHNPFEPAALGSAILHGPHVSNFAEIYGRLAAARAARQVDDSDSLARAVVETLEPARAAAMAHAAWETVSSGAEVTDRVIETILARLPGKDG